MADRPSNSERKPRFSSLSGLPIERVYTPDQLKDWTPGTALGQPGEFPYTRGVYPTMYRGRVWTMRQFAGFGTAEDTNQRFQYLLRHGQTGLSVAFDMPTLMGLDSDDPKARGEVGYCGVAVSSLADMDRLFADIPLDQVTVSMTINGPASVLFAMFLAVAERRGIPLERLGGTLQNDILKEYIAQKEWLFPPGPSLRLITDTVAYCAHHVPKWHPISISGYHIREAG
ncbi:MAG: methylmalonyl-CoA mutase family protein, partial [Nitrospirales bacterium]